MDRGTLGCDDGNLVDGDGCDSTCNVENGWICHAKTTIVASVCYEITWPNIVDYWLEKDNSELHIKFNETALITSGWNYTDWNIYVSGPIKHDEG